MSYFFKLAAPEALRGALLLCMYFLSFSDSEASIKRVVSHLEIILSLLNTCSSQHGVTNVVLTTVLAVIAGVHGSMTEKPASSPAVLALPCTQAACRVLQNVRYMVQITESCMSVHFENLQLVDGIPGEIILLPC